MELAIGILARDCESTLPHNIETIEKLRKQISARVVVVENDSKDKTKELLRQWQSTFPGVILDSFNMGKEREEGKGTSRIEKMVYVRNRLMDNLAKHGEGDFVMFLDIDLCDFDWREVVHTLRCMDTSTGAVFANGTMVIKHGNESFPLGMYYDSYAYLGLGEDLQHDYVMHNFRSPFACVRRRRSIEKQLARQKFLKCQSAFGGLAIYRREAIRDLRYKLHTLEGGKALCEHVPFNQQVLSRGYDCLINKDLHTKYGEIEARGLRFALYKRIPSLIDNLSILKHEIFH